jgi:hypothetical protein
MSTDDKRNDNKRRSVPRREIIKAAVGGSVATATAMAAGPAFAGRSKRRCHHDVIERDELMPQCDCATRGSVSPWWSGKSD